MTINRKVVSKEGRGMRGRLHILVTEAATGRILRDEWNTNKIVTSGEELMRDLLLNGNEAPTHISVGTDATAPDAADTTLTAEVFRGLITRRIPTDGPAKGTFQIFIPTGDANGNPPLNEAGIFNAATNGDMLSRVTFANINKTPAITVTLTWEITISEA